MTANSPKPRALRPVLFGLLMGAVVGGAFIFGFAARDMLPGVRAQASDTQQDSYPLLTEVQTLLDQHYLREQPDVTTRQYAAIRGMLAVLGDRYTFFIDPPVAASESDVLAGTYGGIGVEIRRNEQGELVMYPYADSPAEAAGIVNDDVLLAVNDLPIELTTPQDAIDQMLRGEVKEGSGVEIRYRSADSAEERTQFIAFGVINVPSVIWRTLDEAPGLGYMHILRFTSRTPDEVREGLRALDETGITGLVLDLRGNAGGLLAESIAVADEFIDAGVLAYERNRDGEQAFNGQAGGLGAAYPLIVIVNNGTASGAELLAGALRDRERAQLVGQTTYGKGTIQQIYTLADGSSLHVTAAEWLTPDQVPLENVGLEPDIPMIPDVNGRDVELGEAIRRLNEQPAE